MILRVLVSCDGTRPADSTERCRAWVAFDHTSSRGAVRFAAARAGWSHAENRDLCPACTREKKGQA